MYTLLYYTLIMNKHYNTYICYLLNKYKIPDLLCLSNSDVMECYQELILNIIEFMLEYVNTNLLQTMYYDLYDEIYEETNEIFYPYLIETNLLVNLFNIHNFKIFINYIKLTKYTFNIFWL